MTHILENLLKIEFPSPISATKNINFSDIQKQEQSIFQIFENIQKPILQIAMPKILKQSHNFPFKNRNFVNT